MSIFGDLIGRGQRKPTPEEVFTRRDEEFVRTSTAVKAILETEGFRRIVMLIQNRRAEVGARALHDDTHSKEWWQGYDRGVASLWEMLDEVMKHADDVLEEHALEEVAAEQMKSAGGEFSV